MPLVLEVLPVEEHEEKRTEETTLAAFLTIFSAAAWAATAGEPRVHSCTPWLSVWALTVAWMDRCIAS
jgi:hypothetical protein